VYGRVVCAPVLPPSATDDPAYAARLASLESAWWKRALGVQMPYRLHLRRLDLGFTLDVGCGIGRNLVHLRGNGVGIDHNPASVRIARERGVQAFTPGEFKTSPFAVPGRFDSMLCSHVVEHMAIAAAVELLTAHLVLVRAGGRIVLIAPQERGFRSDPTHVTFVDFDGLDEIADRLGLVVEARRSFPFPRPAGRWFPHNEFVVVARVG
jgi:SAM-dependent methyltransferase